jgi:hypothetical protein
MPFSATKEERDKSEALVCGNEVRASVPLSLRILSKLRPNKRPPSRYFAYFHSVQIIRTTEVWILFSFLDHRRGVKACYARGVQRLGFVVLSCHLMKETEAVLSKSWF